MTGDDYDRVFLDQDQPRLHVLLHPLGQAPHHWHHPLLLPGHHQPEDLPQDEAEQPLHRQKQIIVHEESWKSCCYSHSYR